MDSERLEELDEELFENEEFVEEVVIDPTYTDSLDELEDEIEEEKNRRFVKGSRIFWAVLAFINALLICGSVYMNFFMWNPKERDLCKDNIFCGNDLSISSDTLNSIVSSMENELGISIDEEFRDEYALLSAIMDNDCLTDSEKDIFYSFIDIIKDNPYIDREEAYSSLRNVEVSRKCRPYMYDKSIQGVYSHELENIGIFEDDKDNLILIHEGIHCIFCNEKTKNLPKYFKEGMTELLVNEYFDSKPFAELQNYPFEVVAVRMLCEITSPDVVLKAYSCGDMSIIAEEMNKITRNEDDTNTALEAFCKYMMKYEGDLEEDTSYQDLANICIPVFRGIISAKYDEKHPNRISYYYNEILLANIMEEDAYDKYVDDLVEFGTDHKAYFSSKLKQKLATEKIEDKISEESTKKLTK
ncbi:MAG: hypothetical protein IJA30_03010 [Bacilli bacterium]|nr:hypothetical protein [Bacilli bacterium]